MGWIVTYQAELQMNTPIKINTIPIDWPIKRIKKIIVENWSYLRLLGSDSPKRVPAITEMAKVSELVIGPTMDSSTDQLC